jgi:hypothetical protein
VELHSRYIHPDFKRFLHRSEGWTCRSIAEHGMPALRASFYPLDRRDRSEAFPATSVSVDATAKRNAAGLYKKNPAKIRFDDV